MNSARDGRCDWPEAKEEVVTKILLIALTLFSTAALRNTFRNPGSPLPLACPPSGTCAKASQNCQGRPQDGAWCAILERCQACGWPY
jgi:hypothetical protein